MEPEPKEKVQQIKEKAFEGIGMLVGREAVMKFFSFLGQLFLFRYLAPEAFGIFAIVSFVVNFFGLFSDLGLTSAIIQKRNNLEAAEISSILVFKQTLSIALVVLIFLGAPAIVNFYPNIPGNGVWMIRVFSLSLLLAPIQSVLEAVFERELAYHIVSVIDISGIVVYQISAIGFALAGLNAWSFILAVLVKETVELLLSLHYAKTKISLSFDLQKIQKMVHFGIFIQGQSIVLFFHDALNPLIIGKTYGVYQVGLLNWGNNIVGATQDITGNLARVAFPTFSKLQDNEEHFRKGLKKSLVFLSIFSFYFTIIIFTCGREIVHFVFTDKWIPALPALYWYTVANTVNILLVPVVPAILATGKSKSLFKISVWLTLGEWIFIVLFLRQFGYLAVPISSTIVALFALFGYFKILNRIDMFWETIREMIPKTIYILVLVCASQMFNGIFPSTFLAFVLKITVISLLYMTLLLLFSRGEVEEVKKVLRFQVIGKLFQVFPISRLNE